MTDAQSDDASTGQTDASTGQVDASNGQAATPALAIVGVGNEIMGDDGLGPTMIRRLQESALDAVDDVRLVNAGTTAFMALEGMSGADRAVVLDAIRTGDDPGRIHEYRCVDGSFEGEVPEVTLHDFSFTEALVAGRDAYDLPGDIRILGVEPAAVSPGVGLSTEIEDAMTDVGALLLEEIGNTDPDILAAVGDRDVGGDTQGDDDREVEDATQGRDPRTHVLERVTDEEINMLHSNNDGGHSAVQHQPMETEQ